jgi:hypothetical protein
MRHPFESVPRAARPRLLLPLPAAALLVPLAWVLTAAPMSNARAAERRLRHRVGLPRPPGLLDGRGDGLRV